MKKVISQIAVHRNPHLDELVAIMLLRNYGEEKFPGVSTAKIVTWGKKEISSSSPERAAMNGILLVGIGGGMFDDHGSDVRKDCSATLVAKYLGLAENQELKRFLLDVFQADSQAVGALKHLADEVQNLNRYWIGSLDPEILYKQMEPFIVSKIEKQKEYLEAKDRFAKCYRKTINGINLVAADQFENKQFQHVARNGGAHVIIQRNEAGLTQILANEDLDMPGLAIRLRKAEISIGKLKLSRFYTDQDLECLGTISEVPHWYVDRAFLLNGSESFEDVPRSAIPFREVVFMVEKHMAEFVSH